MKYLISFAMILWSYHALSQSDDLMILDEKVRIAISGIKPSFTKFYVTKEVTYKVLTEKGAEQLRFFSLPEPMDEAYLNRAPVAYNANFYISDLELTEFKIELKTSYDRWIEKRFKQTYEWEDALLDPNMGYSKLQKITHKLPLLKPGSVVRIYYAWNAPLLSNITHLGSNYIYHHGRYVKQSHELEIEYPKNLNLEIAYYNGNTPHQVFESKGGMMTEVWQYKNLPASLNEVGIRPYEELPHLSFTLKNFTFYTQFSRFPLASTGPLEWPLCHLVGMWRNKDLYQDEMSIRIGNTSRQYTALRQFVDGFRNEDLTPYEIFKAMHDSITIGFSYMDDEEVYRNKTMSDPKLGEDLLDRELHDMLRYRTYNALLHQSGSTFFFAYLSDRNHSLVNVDILKPFLHSDYLFAVLDDETRVHFVYPKYRNCGYFMDELPFYFENTEVVLLSYLNPMDVKVGKNDLISPEIRLMKSLSSKKEENARTVNVVITLDSEDSLRFKAQMTLNGQFSTMLRPLYLCGETTLNVHPDYNRYFWQAESDVQLRSHSAKITSSDFPFTTKVTASFDLPVEKTDEGTYVVHIGKWLQHIYHDNVDSSGRSLDYHPDFVSQDRFTFQLTTDLPIDRIDLPEPIYVDNAYGRYQFKISRQSDQALMVLSNYTVKSERVPKSSIGEVIEVHTALNNARSATIRLHTSP